jgi:LysM repeat protein
MFAMRSLLLACAVAVVVVLAVARPSSSSGAEQRYVVRSGDTLWQLAAERYGGDPREGVWQIRARNGLEGADLRVGTVLFLPAAAAGS